MLPEWFDAGLCRTVGRPDWWHAEGQDADGLRSLRQGKGVNARKAAELRRAVAVCNACPIVAQCLLYAIDHPHIASGGVWGGRTAVQREKRARFVGGGA
jgi:hypothetical protein